MRPIDTTMADPAPAPAPPDEKPPQDPAADDDVTLQDEPPTAEEDEKNRAGDTGSEAPPGDSGDDDDDGHDGDEQLPTTPRPPQIQTQDQDQSDMPTPTPKTPTTPTLNVPNGGSDTPRTAEFFEHHAQPDNRPRTDSQSTAATTATAATKPTRSSLVFVVTALETIAASKDARKTKKLGDATASALTAIKQVGDPSGKDETRQMRTVDEIEANKNGIKQVFAKFLPREKVWQS